MFGVFVGSSDGECALEHPGELMGREIERKFLVSSRVFEALAEGLYYRQGYLNLEKERVVRVRVIGEAAYLTIKGITVGATRAEYEYEIPVRDARELLDHLCHQPTIEKHRYKIPMRSHIWEVDVFHGENEGLVLAEIELQDEAEPFEKPDWVGAEVTDDPRYYNSNLIEHPYSEWFSRDIHDK